MKGKYKDYMYLSTGQIFWITYVYIIFGFRQYCNGYKQRNLQELPNDNSTADSDSSNPFKRFPCFCNVTIDSSVFMNVTGLPPPVLGNRIEFSFRMAEKDQTHFTVAIWLKHLHITHTKHKWLSQGMSIHCIIYGSYPGMDGRKCRQHIFYRKSTYASAPETKTVVDVSNM